MIIQSKTHRVYGHKWETKAGVEKPTVFKLEICFFFGFFRPIVFMGFFVLLGFKCRKPKIA